MHVLAGWWACVVALATVLGAAGLLTAAWLMISAAAVSFTLLAWSRRWRTRGGSLEHVETTGGVAGGFMNRAALLVWWAIGCLWGAYVLFNGLLKFPTDWDSLAYHIPMVNQWLHAQNLYAPDCSHWSNPGNFEIVCLWIVAPFSGDFLIHLANLPVVILLALAALELGKNLGLNSIASHLAAFAVASNFVVLRQLTDSENDVAVAALWLACLAYALRYFRSAALADLIFGGICFGLLAGVKFYALGYAAVAGVTLIGGVAWRRGGVAALRAAAVWALAGVFLGGYWYVRNTVVTGNPLFPAGAEMKRMYPEVAVTSLLGNPSPEVFPLAVRAVGRMTGPYHLAALVGLPVILFWLLGTGYFRGRKEGRRAQPRWLLAWLLAASGLVWLSTPFAVEDAPGTLNHLRWGYTPVRYGLCFLSLAVIGFTLVVQDLAEWLKRFPRPRSAGGTVNVLRHGARLLGLSLYLALGLGALYQTIAPDDRVSPPEGDVVWVGLDCFLIGWNLVVWWPVWRRWGTWLLVSATIAGVAGVVLGVNVLSRRWHDEFPRFYGTMFGTNVFSELARLDPAKVRLAVLDYRVYPFFGSARQFRVWHPMRVPSYPWLAENLAERRITHAAIRMEGAGSYEGWNRYRHLDQWFAERPEVFAPVEAQLRPSLFSVDLQRLGAVLEEHRRWTRSPPLIFPGEKNFKTHLTSVSALDRGRVWVW